MLKSQKIRQQSKATKTKSFQITIQIFKLMKTNYFLKLEIELAELQVKLANHRLDKHYAMEKEQFEQAADTRKWEKEIKIHIRS